MDYEEKIYNSTKTKSKPQLKLDENWKFQCRSLLEMEYSDTVQVMDNIRYNDRGKPQKHGQQRQGKKLILLIISKMYFSYDWCSQAPGSFP